MKKPRVTFDDGGQRFAFMRPVETDLRKEHRVTRNVGGLPNLWNRNAVFVANLLSLFFGNRAETQVLREHVGSIETYGGRLIPILDLLFRGKNNLLILEDSPDGALCDYFEGGLKLSIPAVEVASHQDYAALREKKSDYSKETRRLIEIVRAHPAEWIDGFVTDSALVRLAELAGKKLITSLESSHRGNNKFLLHEFLVSQKLPVFDTEIATHPEDVPECIQKLASQGYRRGVVKAQVGASGIGLVRLDLEAPGPVPDYLFHEGPCLVQGWLEAAEGIEYVGSPSVQMLVRDDQVCLYDVTDQILSSASVHEGNMAPPASLEKYPSLQDELLRQAEVGAVWLQDQGYRGTASADFHVVYRHESLEVRLCEINARVTGATYPSLLARTFRPGGAWLMRNVRFTQPYSGQLLLDALDDACLLFRPEMKSGVLPINFNLTRDGYVSKGQFLAIGGELAEVRELFRSVRNLETILWEYDRA
jgi:hypothetical protein